MSNNNKDYVLLSRTTEESFIQVLAPNLDISKVEYEVKLDGIFVPQKDLIKAKVVFERSLKQYFEKTTDSSIRSYIQMKN